MNTVPYTFETVEDAEEYFGEHFTESDDSDKEEARFMAWLEGVHIKNPPEEYTLKEWKKLDKRSS